MESCEYCHPDDAEIPFDWLLAGYGQARTIRIYSDRTGAMSELQAAGDGEDARRLARLTSSWSCFLPLRSNQPLGYGDLASLDRPSTRCMTASATVERTPHAAMSIRNKSGYALRSILM